MNEFDPVTNQRPHKMFRSLNEDEGGFVNEGLEVCDDDSARNTPPESYSFDVTQPTRIQITRAKYDQQKLHDEMKYKKPASKSSESCVLLTSVQEQSAIAKRSDQGFLFTIHESMRNQNRFMTGLGLKFRSFSQFFAQRHFFNYFK